MGKNDEWLQTTFINLSDSQCGPIRYDVFQTNSIYGQSSIGSLPDIVVLVGGLGG